MSIHYALRETYENSPSIIRDSIGKILGCIPIDILYGEVFSTTRRLLNISEFWNQDQYLEYQALKLRELFSIAVNEVPYYRRLFADLNLKLKNVVSASSITSIPLLTRKIVQETQKGLIPEGISKQSYKYVTTGGSSGKPLGFYITHDASAAEWAFMYKNWSRAGFKPGDKRAVFRGRLIRGKENGRLWEHDPINNALYFSSFDLNIENFKKYYRVMEDYRPEFIHAYPSSAVLLANFMKQSGIVIPSIRGLLLGSEGLLPAQRDYLEEVFGCKTFTWYGHSEKCVLAGECEYHNGLHVFPEYGITELLDHQGYPIYEPGVRGTIVSTSFINKGTIFIRYVTDDEAEWAGTKCPCGRNTPRLINVVGHRNQELLMGKSQALISMTALNLHSKIYTKMKQFQFYQDTPGKAVLKIIPVDNYSKEDQKYLIQEFNARIGTEIDLTIELVKEIPCSQSGKYKFIDQKLTLSNFPFS